MWKKAYNIPAAFMPLLKLMRLVVIMEKDWLRRDDDEGDDRNTTFDTMTPQ